MCSKVRKAKEKEMEVGGGMRSAELQISVGWSVLNKRLKETTRSPEHL